MVAKRAKGLRAAERNGKSKSNRLRSAAETDREAERGREGGGAPTLSPGLRMRKTTVATTRPLPLLPSLGLSFSVSATQSRVSRTHTTTTSEESRPLTREGNEPGTTRWVNERGDSNVGWNRRRRHNGRRKKTRKINGLIVVPRFALRSPFLPPSLLRYPSYCFPMRLQSQSQEDGGGLRCGGRGTPGSGRQF